MIERGREILSEVVGEAFASRPSARRRTCAVALGSLAARPLPSWVVLKARAGLQVHSGWARPPGLPRLQPSRELSGDIPRRVCVVLRHNLANSERRPRGHPWFVGSRSFRRCFRSVLGEVLVDVRCVGRGLRAGEARLWQLLALFCVLICTSDASTYCRRQAPLAAEKLAQDAFRTARTKLAQERAELAKTLADASARPSRDA